MSENPLKNGQLEQHTRADGADAQRDLMALIDQAPDIDATDVLGATAELMTGPRRGKNRPNPFGGGSRRTRDRIAYLELLGHRDPLTTLSLIQTADTMQLAKALGSPAIGEGGRPITNLDGSVVMIPADPLKILAIQRQAAKDLAEWSYARPATEVDIRHGAARPVMVIGQITVEEGATLGIMTAGEAPAEPEAPTIEAEQ